VPALLRALPRWQRHKGVWLTLRPVQASDYDCVAMLTVRLYAFDPALHSIDYKWDPHPEEWRIYLGTIPPDKIEFPIVGQRSKRGQGQRRI
jgi:hypothetical protein